MPNELDLFPVVEARQCWHCAIHGTVSECPFTFMRCDVAATTLDAAPLSGRGWLAQLRKTKATTGE